MSTDLYDAAIIGAGPAGAAAAITLARSGRNVVWIERSKFPRKVSCSGWVSAKAVAFLKQWGVRPKSILDTPFTDVTFFSADFAKRARPQFTDTPGYVVDRAVFDQALAEHAVKSKVNLLQGSGVADVQLDESSVAIRLTNKRTVTSRLLLLAPGRSSPLCEKLGVSKEPGTSPVWTAQVSAKPRSGKAPDKPRVAVVLGLDGGASFGFCCAAPDRISIDVNWAGDPARTQELLARIARLAFEHEVVPTDLSSQAASANVVRTPAEAALEMDSHVRKHTLLIGDAGGFVSAVSNEGIYPAMWSGRIAAEIVHEALDAEPSQDTLMKFDSRWRIEMADHLRSPHTDIRFLLPLVFTNQPMADRMGATFFFGENI